MLRDACSNDRKGRQGYVATKDLGSASREHKASLCQTLANLAVTHLFILTYVLEEIQHPFDPEDPYKSLLRHASSSWHGLHAIQAHFNDGYTGM
jgi:hypothetical protein